MFFFIYKDVEEQEAWKDYLAGLDNMNSYIYINNKELSQHIKGLNQNISVFGISSEIFVAECPGLIDKIKEISPLSEFCIFLSNSTNPISFRCLIKNKINHVLIKPNEDEEYVKEFYRNRFTITIKKIARHERLDITDYVSPDTKIYSEEVNNTDQKETLIKKVEDLINGENDEIEFFKQRVALVADEMLENALFGAPKTDVGNNLFKKGDARSTLNKEKIIFFYAYDGKTLTMEISDNWGSLVPNTVLELLEKNNNGEEVDFETPGGRGFFIMSRFFDLFHIIIDPGKETKVGGHLLMNPNFDPMNKKGFHIQVQKN